MRWLVCQFVLLLPILNSKPAIPALDGCTYTYESPGGLTGAPIKLNEQSCKIMQGTAKALEVSFKSLREKDTKGAARLVPQMVTGLSQRKTKVFVRHFYNWMAMLPPGMKLVVYDLNGKENKEFFNGLQAELDWDPERVILRRFPFEEYPKHVRDLGGTYAFKPLIVDIIIQEFGAALWMDASIVLQYSPSKISDFIVYGEPVTWAEQIPDSIIAKQRKRTEGCALYHADNTHHTIAKYTHEAMMSFIPPDGGIEFTKITEMMSAQYLIYNTAFCHQFLLMPLVACALAPECITPKFSTRGCSNKSPDGWNQDGTRCHRQDQSTASLLFLNNCGAPIDGCTMQSLQYSSSGLPVLSEVDRGGSQNFSKSSPTPSPSPRPVAASEARQIISGVVDYFPTPLTVVVAAASVALVVLLVMLLRRRSDQWAIPYRPLTSPTEI